MIEDFDYSEAVVIAENVHEMLLGMCDLLNNFESMLPWAKEIAICEGSTFDTGSGWTGTQVSGIKHYNEYWLYEDADKLVRFIKMAKLIFIMAKALNELQLEELKSNRKHIKTLETLGRIWSKS